MTVVEGKAGDSELAPPLEIVVLPIDKFGRD